jgi:glycosyltransferase involved in cell wall biosynthesis
MQYVTFPREATLTRLLRYQFAYFHLFRDFYRTQLNRERPDVIYLVNLDYCDKAMAVRGSPFGDCRFVGMLMSAKFHHADAGIAGECRRPVVLHRLAFRRLLNIATLQSVLSIDETLLQFSTRRRIPGAEKLKYVPDIASLETMPDRSVGRRKFGFLEDDFVILVYGRLSARKGIRQLLRAASSIECISKTKLLLAGNPDGDTVELLQSPVAERLRSAGRLIEVLRLIDGKTEEGLLFAAADAVWLGYAGHAGMSGVLVQAARAGHPVIACREGLIGWFTQHHAIGQVVDIENPAEVARCIELLAKNEGLREQYAQTGRRLAAMHTPEKFSHLVCDAIGGGNA